MTSTIDLKTVDLHLFKIFKVLKIIYTLVNHYVTVISCLQLCYVSDNNTTCTQTLNISNL